MAILLSLVLAFCFSTLAFATGEEVKVDEAVSSDEFVYTDGADEYSDSTEDMLADIYGEDFAEAAAKESAKLVEDMSALLKAHNII